jgi:aminoglycoside phosphotransferase (APT) family kinase protein
VIDERKDPNETHIRAIVEQHFSGREITRVEKNTAGITHLNYEIGFKDGTRIFYRGHNPKGAAADGRDIYFGDPLSLEREIAVIGHLKMTEVPVVEVYAHEEGPLGEYALVSFMEGIPFAEYLKARGHKIDVFFDALRKIGRTLASTRKVTFDQFGGIQPEGIVGGVPFLADRLANILTRHVHNPKVMSHFTDGEWTELSSQTSAMLGSVRESQRLIAKPQLVIGDLHVRNFMVHPEGDRAGDISGAFDVELAQAAHPSLEWAFMNVGIFPLYGVRWFRKAKDAFLEGYRGGGGDATEHAELERIYLMNHALSATGFYNGLQDGIRDTWSGAFKQWALDIARGKYDPAMVVELTRFLTKVPRID